MPPLKWQADRVIDFLQAEFPQAFAHGRHYTIARLESGHARVAFTAGHAELRPGGTVSGPVLMELVDFSIYVLLIAHHCEAAALAVTTNLQISFLRKAQAGELFCDIELIKHGRTLTVGDARITNAGDERLIAHAQATYYMANAY